jgi:hypothetical protein
LIHKELILILIQIQIEITKIKQRKIWYPLTVTQKINKSPLTFYNYTKILNKYENTLNYYWITQILYYT